MDSLLRERRLVTRVFRRWTALAEGRRFPSRSQIEASLIGEERESCAVIKLDAEVKRSTFLIVGPNLVPPGHAPLEGKPITDCPSNTLLSAMLKYLPRFQPNGGPLGITGTADHLGTSILHRSVLLPLSDDGTQIDSVFGVASFRALRQGEDKELRTRPQVVMLDVESGQIWEIYEPLVGAWSRATVVAVEGERVTLRHRESRRLITCSKNEMAQRTERYRFLSYS
jgi:hypothetical protein